MQTDRHDSTATGPRARVPFRFDLRVHDIAGTGGNGFPQSILDTIQQKNYLETLLRASLEPTRVFRPRVIGPLDWFDARIGETKTFTASALIAPTATALNPANNTGLDNGMTADVRGYEQWVATLNEYPGFIPTNILGQEAFIADIFEDNQKAMAQKAGDSLELLCVLRAMTSYDTGDTFVTVAGTGSPTTYAVDNINGFDTQFLATELPSYPAPTTVSTTNKIAVLLLDKTDGHVKGAANCQLATPDGTNASYMQSGGNAFGRSGVLTVDSSLGSCSVGDRIVAVDAACPTTTGSTVFLDPRFKDGSYVVRPLSSNVMRTTAIAMTSADVLNPSVMIPYAVSILKRRRSPKLPNGLYGCAVDSTLLAALYSDTGFQRATATNWDRGAYFTEGVVAAGWGVEFIETTQIPVYAPPAGGGSGFSLRHAFCFGLDVIAEHPFAGAKNAAAIVARVGDVADERWVERIKFRSLAAIDTLGQVIKFAYDYVGDFVPRTDKSSTPKIVFSSDYCRYKRGVILQVAAPF